jgi:hypothetical protein
MASLVLGGFNTRISNTWCECPLIVGSWVTNSMEEIRIMVSHIIKYLNQMGKRVNITKEKAFQGITCTIAQV